MIIHIYSRFPDPLLRGNFFIILEYLKNLNYPQALLAQIPKSLENELNYLTKTFEDLFGGKLIPVIKEKGESLGHSFKKTLEDYVGKSREDVYVISHIPNDVRSIKLLEDFQKRIVYLHVDPELLGAYPHKGRGSESWKRFRALGKTKPVGICVSDKNFWKYESFNEYFGLFRRLIKIENGIPVEFYQQFMGYNKKLRKMLDIDEDSIVITYMGRVNKLKGSDILRSTILKIFQDNYLRNKVTLILAAPEGKNLKEIHDMLSELIYHKKIERENVRLILDLSKITTRGLLNRWDKIIMRYYAERIKNILKNPIVPFKIIDIPIHVITDIFLFPSLLESYSLVLAEYRVVGASTIILIGDEIHPSILGSENYIALGISPEVKGYILKILSKNRSKIENTYDELLYQLVVENISNKLLEVIKGKVYQESFEKVPEDDERFLWKISSKRMVEEFEEKILKNSRKLFV